MPSLPRIKRTRPRSGDGEVLARPEPRVQELSANGLTWIHLDAPTLEEAELLQRRFGWHPLDLEDVLSRRQRPKIDEYGDEGYLFVVLHFPVYDKRIQRLNAAELDLFIGQDYLVTLPNVELLPVARLFHRCHEDLELRAQLFGKGSGYLLYHVLDDLFDYCFPILDKIGHKLYSDDIVDASERIWDILDNYKEVVEALEDTNESAINHRQNDILRVLTVVSVILLPMTLITGIFGMNVHFPGFATAAAWWAIVASLVTLAVGLAAFFRYKRWL